MDAKLIVLFLYVLMIVIVGIRSFQGTKNFNDFFLGGGRVGPWMSAFSYGTAYFSAVLFIGFAGNIGWNFGYSGLWIALCNALVGVMLVWWLVAPRIKKAAAEMQIHTLPEYLEKRYDSSAFKLISSVVIFVFMIPYSAAVFMGLSHLFTSNFDIAYGYGEVTLEVSWEITPL